MSTDAQIPTTGPTGPVTETIGPATTNADVTDTPLPTDVKEDSALGPAEGAPSDKANAEAVPNVTNAPKEEKIAKGEVKVESHPINEGVLNLKSPGIKGIIPLKKYFWFSDAPLEEQNLTAYISNEKSKDVAHANASHATQTGKGLLFYAKRAEDKDHPQGILNLADLSDVAKGNFNDFSASVNGHKYTFQATTRAERDGWIVAIETKIPDAKSSKGNVIGSEGYKAKLENFAKPTATTSGASKTRSLSRPKKEKESKSRERKTAVAPTKDAKEVKTEASKTEKSKEILPTAVTDSVADKPAVAETDGKKGLTDDKKPEIAVAGVAATTRKDSSEDDNKEKKSRSQSRGNKRASIFSGLLAKKEESDDKKAAKKAEKGEKKEEKKEEKAAVKEDEQLVAAAKSGEEKKEKAAKKEEKKEEKAKKEEQAAAAAAKKEQEKAKAEEKAEEKAAAAAAKAEEKKQEHAEKEAKKEVEDLEHKAEKEAEKAAKHEAKAEELAAEASEKKEVVAASSPASTTPASTTKEKPNKRASVFGSLFGKKDTASIPAEKTNKDEPSTVSDTAPQLDSPVPITTEPAAGAKDDKTEAKPTTEAATSTSPQTPTDKRRTSFFSNLGTKKEKKPDTTSGDETADGEKKKQSGGIGGLLRKASRAAPKKESKETKADAVGTTPPKESIIEDKVSKPAEDPLSNGDGPVDKPTGLTEAKPVVAEDAPVAAVSKPEETPFVETKA